MAEHGVKRWGAVPGFLYFLTLTAPGKDRVHKAKIEGRWVDCHCSVGVDLGAWNASHSARWNRLRTALRKQHPGMQFWRGIETQDRGALHDHALVWSPTPLLEREVRRLAGLAGFGHELYMPPIQPGSKREAYYVSKYVSKACDQRAEVPWLAEVVDTETGEVTEALVPARYRTWSMSRDWGLTMAQVRTEAAEYAALMREKEDALALADAMAALAAVLPADPVSTILDG